MCLRNHVKITLLRKHHIWPLETLKYLDKNPGRDLKFKQHLCLDIFTKFSVCTRKYLFLWNICSVSGLKEVMKDVTFNSKSSLQTIECTCSSLNILYCIIGLAWPCRSIILAAYVSFSAVLIFESEHYSGYFDASFHIIKMLLSHQNIAKKFTLELFAPKQANTLYFIYTYIVFYIYICFLWMFILWD